MLENVPMKKWISALSSILLLLLALVATGFFYLQVLPDARKDLEAKISNLSGDVLKESGRVEQSIVQNLPILSDFSSPAREQMLRKYLLQYHLDVAGKKGVGPVYTDGDLERLVKTGKLVSIDNGKESFFYFYNVAKKYRVLTPAAAKGLETLVNRIQENLKKEGGEGNVKIALSSVTRPVDYQKDLRGRNSNASFESSHSSGVSFDIFYDDYFTVLPDPVEGPAQEFRENLKRKLGFLLGDALSRQYHALVMKTLLEMQEEGTIYAILEKRQRVYHVTIR